MKHTKLFTFLLTLSAVFLVITSCERDLTPDLDDPVFKVMNEDGTDLPAQIAMNFNSSATYTVEMSNVVKTNIEVPTGWGCEVAVAKRTLTITSPDIENLDAAAEGNITITANGTGKSTAKAVISVKAVEQEISLECTDPDITAPVEFLLLGSKTFTFSASSNVANLIVSDPPTGWTITPDWENMKLKISAPIDIDENTQTEGSIVVTPVSNRGVEGTPVTIRVVVDATAPVLEFDQSEVWFAFGDNKDVTITRGLNIKEVKLAEMQYPQGWTVVPDLENMKITITAPAAGATGIARGGKIIVPVISHANFDAEAELYVMLGICSADDMLAFGDVIASGGRPDEFAINGEVRLMSDIDLSTVNRDVIVGAEDKPFLGTFNGNSKKITLAINAAGANAGIFHTLGAGAKVHDLTLEGTIVSTIGNANIGVLVLYNDGAELNKISSSVSLDYTGGTNTGSFGGLVASNIGSGKYIDCHTSGTLKTNGLQYFGGLVGNIAPNTQGTMTDCSNSGNITLNYGALAMTNALAAGCVGRADESSWTFTRISNTGNIDYNFGKAATSGIRGLGGAFGIASGTYKDCFNTGNVIDTDGDDAVLNTNRFTGGFAGQSCDKEGYPIVATGCYNTGKVVGISNYIAGFMGAIRAGSADKPNKLTDCYNSGNVRVVSKTTLSGMFGGFLAVSYKYAELTRCKNSGSVVGNTNRSVAGLVGAGADNLTIDQCENSGMVVVGGRIESNPRSGRPFVAGIAAIRAVSPVKITNSKNTGSITATVHDASHVQSVHVSERVVYDGDLVDPVTCDAATITASAGATIKAILPNDWASMVLPE